VRSERQLRDEIRLREASLEDASREHDAGELSDADYASIAARENTALDEARLALSVLEVEVREAAAPLPTATRRVRRPRRLVIALACFVLAAGVLVWANLGLRQAGTSATGGLDLTQNQKLQQLLSEAQSDLAGGDAAAALSAYQQILALQPTNVAALTEAGWLDFSAGSSRHDVLVVTRGVSLLREALSLAPHSPAPRLYYAIVADATPGNKTLATREFKVFLTQHPSAAQLAIAAPFLRSLGLKV
jgi:hypothetical protein